MIDLHTGKARTLAGTGKQMRTRSDRDEGALSSPWDLSVVEQTIYVAMAGIHQIWAIDSKTGGARVHSGTDGEDITDGPHSSALLAQPMGITTDGKRLYFADAESSAIRWADVDPDGIGEKVRMQHQQGVARRNNGELLVDTNAHRIMVADYESGQLRVLEISS